MLSHRSPSPAEWRYGLPAILLHWVLALLIAFMVGLGWYMTTVEHKPGGPAYIALHKSVGLIVLFLVALRVIWRAFHRPAPLPKGLPRWQVRLSALVQWALYTACSGGCGLVDARTPKADRHSDATTRHRI
jgi:cytochrome b561